MFARLARRSRLPPAYLFAIVLFWAEAAASAPASAMMQSCVDFFRYVTGDPAYFNGKIREHLPRLVRDHSAEWREGAALRPEGLTGLSAGESLALLGSLRGQGLWGRGGSTLSNSAWGNSLQILPVGSQHVVIKTDQQRTSIEGDRVVSFRSFARYEAIAYALDEFLGTNVVPPALMLDARTAAILYVPGRSTHMGRMTEEPRRLLAASHLRLIDLLLGNADRDAPGNIVVANGRMVGIDFDMSQLYRRSFGTGGPIEYLHANVIVDRTRWLGGRTRMPGVFSRSVIARLTELDRPALERMMPKVGIHLSENEVKNILESRAQLLASVREWAARYGEENILVP